jgi:hypothetical protein
MNLENVALLGTVVSFILAVILFIKHDAVTTQSHAVKHVSVSTIIAALLSSLVLGWYIIVSLPSHLPPLIVFMGAVLSMVAVLIIGELFLQWALLRTHLKLFRLVVILSTLALLSSLFWSTWAWELSSVPSSSNQQANPALATLQAYCQALVRNDFVRASAYLSDISAQVSPVSAASLANNVGTDASQLKDKLVDCSSTVSDSVTYQDGTRYVVGCVIYSFSRGVRYFHQYGLFQKRSSSTWSIDTAYWKKPSVAY